jgi:hypothetical protein
LNVSANPSVFFVRFFPMLQSAPALPARPKTRAIAASRRLEQLLSYESDLSQEDRNTLVQHLAAIESIEARLGSPRVTVEEFEDLVGQCHRLINEAHALHMSSHLKTASMPPFGASAGMVLA